MVISSLNILSIVFSFSMVVFIILSLFYPNKSLVLSNKNKVPYTDLVGIFLILDYIVKTILWVLI